MQNALQQVMVSILLACLCILVILAGQAISSCVRVQAMNRLFPLGMEIKVADLRLEVQRLVS